MLFHLRPFALSLSKGLQAQCKASTLRLTQDRPSSARTVVG